MRVRGLKEGIMSNLSGLKVSAEWNLERNRNSSFTTGGVKERKANNVKSSCTL